MLLFGAETWVLTPQIERALESFMHGAARRIMGKQPWIRWDGKWYYPSLAGAMKEAGFAEIRKPITNRQNTVAQYIAKQPIMDGSAAGATARGGDVGADPTDRAGAGELHARGRAQDHRETAAERVGWEVVLSLSCGGHERGGVCRYQ